MKNKIVEAFKTLLFGKKCWQLKVQPFSIFGVFHTCYYRVRERGTWVRMRKPPMLLELAKLKNRDQPFLGDFKECVEFASQFKSYDDYKKYEDNELEKFDKLCQQNENTKSREEKLTWYSEIK